MRISLITLLGSTLSSLVLWNPDLGHMIWPSHPSAATVLFATLLAWGVQSYLTEKHSKDLNKE